MCPLLIAITGTLIFWLLPTQSQVQDLNNVDYDLTHSGNHYTIRGTFFQIQPKLSPPYLL